MATPIFKHALVGLELSGVDTRVLEFLHFFDKHGMLEKTAFMHVVPWEFTYFSGENPASWDLEDLRKQVEQQIQDELLVFYPDCIHKCEDIIVQPGDPLTEMMHVARDRNTQLLVIGQKAGAASHGILAKNLVRKTPAHALIVPELSRTKVHRICVPVDFSEASTTAFTIAQLIARLLPREVQIDLLHIYENPNISAYKSLHVPQQMKAYLVESKQQAASDFINKYADPALNITTYLAERKLFGIGSDIYNWALEHAADLLIMGAKGHSTLDLLLLGSVTEKLMSVNERIPTLIVK